MEKVRLPVLGTFMEDRNGNVAWSELGVYGVAFPSGQKPGAITGRAVGRRCSFLRALGGHTRVVPRRGAAVVVHEEGPAGLRVDLDLPARGQGVSVAGSVAGRHLHHGRLGGGAHAGLGSARGAELGRESRGRGVRALLCSRCVREAGSGHLYELKDWVTWPKRGGSVWK